MRCNVCDNTKFKDNGPRKMVLCKKCGSLERTRVIKLMVDKFANLNADSRILHMAPERGLSNHFSKIAGDNCLFSDFDPASFKSKQKIQRIDLCNDLAGMASDEFDLIVHSHVLEHVPCNYTYVLYHLHRLLKPAGKMICSIPIMRGFYDASFSPDISEEERQKRFGQYDHMTKFGASDLQMTLGKVYDLPDNYDLTETFSVEELKECNVPENAWKKYTPHSVLMLGKDDYKLR